MITIVEIFNEICCNTASKLNYGLNYDHGHNTDIVNKLNEINNTNAIEQAKKYPLIALMQPFTEENSERKDIAVEIPEIKFIIATISDPKYYPQDRYKNNFPKLLEIKNEFLNQTKLAKYFEFNYLEPQFDSTDSWIKDRILTDYVDFISLNIKNLKLRKIYCIIKNQI